MPDYRIEIHRRAKRSLSQLDRAAQRAVEQVINGLGEEPRPSTAKPLKFFCSLRIRHGDYRVIYTVNDRAKIVTIVVIRHRRDAYRNLRSMRLR
jgi:mRNA interferase RelE/StbE